MKPTVGRIVHYVLREGRNTGEHRPAIIVRVWTDTTVQLQVFTDKTNDDMTDGVIWQTSVMLDDSSEKIGTWHWPERED